MPAFLGMSVSARPTHRTRLRRLRGDRSGTPRGDFQVADRRSAPADVPPPRRADPPQDRAIYTCECGYQFAASVSTSVACPHCGGAQAW